MCINEMSEHKVSVDEMLIGKMNVDKLYKHQMTDKKPYAKYL